MFPERIALSFTKGVIARDALFCSKCDGPLRAINYNFRGFGKRGASNFSNQRNNKPLSSQITPQPTSTGASNTRKQWSFFNFFFLGIFPSVVDLLSNGFNCGFPLHYEGPQDSSCARNLLSANQNPEAVDIKLDKELAAQRIAGPFSSPPFPHFRISPFGLFHKKTEGEFRLIHHLFFPQVLSLNDGISSEFTSVIITITITVFLSRLLSYVQGALQSCKQHY